MLPTKLITRINLPYWILIFLPLLLRLPALLGILSTDPMLFVASIGDSAHMRSGSPWIDPNVGFQAQALGKLSADQWLSGQIPWWNSYNGVGLPLAAEAQPGSLFLPFVLLYHFRSGGLWVALLLQIIAGLSTYGLLRKIKLSTLASLVGALLFELNGTYAWHGAPIIAPIAFLPMLLLGVEQLRARIDDERSGGWLLIPLALAWSLYAGFPETAYINGLFATVWVLSRLSRLSVRQRLLFIGKLTGAVTLGLICSLPLLVPFAELLMSSDIGSHNGAFAHASLPAASVAHSLMPWLYGRIFSYSDPSNLIFLDWSSTGGYLTALQIAFALLGLQLAPRKLTLALLIWMLLCLVKTFDITPISDFINLIPLIKSAAFDRYSPPSWEFAGVVLTAFAIDAMRRKVPLNSGRAIVSFALILLLASGAVYLARMPIMTMLQISSVSWMTKLALFWLVVSLAIGAVITSQSKSKPGSTHLAASLLVFDACLAFVMPYSSAARNTIIKEQGIAYLQEHVGLQRVYSLGPALAPNYGAYFKIAQINHNYLPIPLNWLNFIHAHLDAAADSIVFIGNDHRINRQSSAEEQLRENLVAYEKLGVRYVLSAPDAAPFVADLQIEHLQNAHQEPLRLTNDQDVIVHWELPKPQATQAIYQASISVGNYNHQSNGYLGIQICLANNDCSYGQRALVESTDNKPFTIALERALPIPDSLSSLSLTIKLHQIQSSFPVAVWMFQIAPNSTKQSITIADTTNQMAPSLSLHLVETAKPVARLAYSGPDMAIYELLNASPYFETAEGRCTLRADSRESVEASCPTQTRLLRREAFYPGWYATIDGKSVVVEQADELFQSVMLPAGKHLIMFGYRPSHFGFMTASFGSGIFILLFGIWTEWDSHRRRRSIEIYAR